MDNFVIYDAVQGRMRKEGSSLASKKGKEIRAYLRISWQLDGKLLRCGTMSVKHVSRFSEEVAKYADTVSESLRKLDFLKILNLT